MILSRRILTKLIAWFLAISIIPMAIVAVLSHIGAERALRSQIENHLAATADAKSLQIHDFFQERINDAITLAQTPTVIEALEQADDDASEQSSWSGVRQLSKSYLARTGYTQLYLLSPAGEIVFSSSTSDSRSDLHRENEDLADELAKVANRAATLLEPSVSESIRVSPTSRVRLIASPVTRDADVVGIAALQISDSRINALVQDYTGLGQTGETLLASRSGKHGDEVLFVTATRHDADVNFRRHFNANEASELPARLAVNGHRGLGESVDYRKQPVLAVWRYVPSFRWGMVIKIDTAEAFAPIRTLRNQAWMIAVFAVLAVIATAVFVSNSLSRPIVKLTRSVQRMSSGSLDERVDIDSQDEIGELAGEFNRMAETIDTNVKQLSQQKLHTQTILDSTADGILTIGDDGDIRSCNRSVESLLDCRSDALTGQRLAQLSPELADAIGTSQNSPTNETIVQVTSATGRRVPLAVRQSEMQSADERIRILTLQDITSREQAENERKRLFEGIRTAVDQLSAASCEILATTSQQASTAQQQAAMVSETTATVEQVTTTASHTAEQAQQVTQSAQHADKVSRAGLQSVRDTMDAMQDVRGQSDSVARAILLLDERTRAIGQFLTVVTDIADQTNVLALNAAVEASRAGQHGRGFAVVAAEVKALSGQSKQSVVEIRKILHEVSQAVSDVVAAGEQGTRSIDHANRVVSQADQVIRTLADTIETASHAASKIGVSVGEQATALTQINLAMTQVEQGTRHTLEANQRAKQLAQDLSQLGEHLVELMQEGRANGAAIAVTAPKRPSRNIRA